MRRRLLERLGQSVVVVFIVTTIAFFVIRAVPGDSFSYDSPNYTPALRARLRAQSGYDQPVVVQYGKYLWNVAHGQFGYSTFREKPVSVLLAETVPRTLALAGCGLLLSLVLGVAIGTMQAARRDSWFDRISSKALLVVYSLPDFWGALMILLLFAYWFPVLPPSGMSDPMHDYMSTGQALLDRLKHFVLPVVSLVLLTMASITRYQRSAMLDALPADHVRSARAKGVSETGVVWRHAFRTALAPMITLLGVMFPALIGGTLFVERVFSWPGMGMLAADAVVFRDYDVVTATVIVGALLVVLGNLVADTLHAALDPRVRE